MSGVSAIVCTHRIGSVCRFESIVRRSVLDGVHLLFVACCIRNLVNAAILPFENLIIRSKLFSRLREQREI